MPDKLTLRENWIIESWENRKLHDLQEENEIPIIEKMETAWSGDSACLEELIYIKQITRGEILDLFVK